MVKEMVTGSPMVIGMLITPSEGTNTGGTAESRNIAIILTLCTVHAVKKLTFYGRTTPTATGVRRLRLRACYAYGYRRTSLSLRAYYAYGYGRIAATTTGVLQPQAYYGLATGCKLTSGHYNRGR